MDKNGQEGEFSMKLTKLSLCAIGIGAILNGCATVPYQGQAHNIKRRPQSDGVVGIPINYRDEDRAKAEQHMLSNCQPGQYRITEEGEAVIGQEVKSSGKETERDSTKHKVGSLFGVPLMSGEAGGKNTESSQVTTAVKEWQISYKCLSSVDTKSGTTKTR